jgi:hypothetical protein
MVVVTSFGWGVARHNASQRGGRSEGDKPAKWICEAKGVSKINPNYFFHLLDSAMVRLGGTPTLPPRGLAKGRGGETPICHILDSIKIQLSGHTGS